MYYRLRNYYTIVVNIINVSKTYTKHIWSLKCSKTKIRPCTYHMLTNKQNWTLNEKKILFCLLRLFMCSNGRTISWENTNLTNNSYTQQFMIYYKICRNENILFQHKYKYTLLLQKKSKWFIIHIICTTHTPYNFRAIFQLALFTRHFFNLCLNNKSGCSGISPDQFQIRQTQASKRHLSIVA